MWELLKIMLLGSSTLLTPEPVDVGTDWIKLTPSKQLSAVTEGANLQIEVEQLFPASVTLIERLEEAEKLFPRGCAQARLITMSGASVALHSNGVSASASNIRTILIANPGVPSDISFSSVMLRADCPMHKARIYWHNASK